MSELPPNIDAILASIRSRMNDDSSLPPEPVVPETAPLATPVADVGAVVLDSGSMTIDGLVRSMIEPLLKAWLDANMPEIVERMAQDEIKRLTGRD
jgi:hypothetical protein